MASPNDYVNNRDGSRILGIPLEGDKQQESLKVGPDTTAWEVYNYHAGRVESEVTKDWSDSLNTLLVFAGLYSGVLTAFITSSMQLLQPDSSDDARDILLHISRQLAVTSTAAFDPSSDTFVPPEWALRVNYCFFFSLSCALITALAAVLALQWVGSYDRGLNPSSIESRALQRQFRMEGAKRWKLEHIIASLPTIIFISLLVFFVGLAEWLWNIHHNVAIIVMVGASVGALFYAITTLASMLSIVAPFRTPASRYLPLWLGLCLKFISGLFERTRPTPATVNTMVASIGAMMTALHPNADIHVPTRMDVAPQTHKTPPWRLFLRRILKPIAPLYSIEPFETREQKALVANKYIKLSSLFWVARSISIEPYHRQTLMLIMQAILEQPEWELQSDHTNSKLWKLIFTELYIPYAGKKKWVDYSSEELRNASLFVRGLCSIGQGFLSDFEFYSLVETFYSPYIGLGAMCRTMKEWKKLDLKAEQRKPSLNDIEEWERERRDSEDNSDPNQTHQEENAVNPAHTIIQFQPVENTGVGERPLDQYRQQCQRVTLANLKIALSSRGRFPLEFVMATLQQVKRNPSNLALIPIQEMFDLITEHLHIKSDDITGARPLPLPFPVLELVQETITTRLSGTVVASLDPVVYSDIVTSYLNKAKSEEAEEARQSAISAHEAIMEQAIANLIQIDALKLSNGPRVQEILVKLDQLAQCKFREANDPVIFALSSMIDTEIDIWSQNNRVYTARSMLSLLKVDDSNFNGENWTVWWTEILPALGKFADEGEATESIVIKHGQRALLAHLPHRGQFSGDQIKSLTNIPHLGVRLFAIAVTQSTTLAQSVLSVDTTQKPRDIWVPSTTWTEFIDLCYRQLNAQASENENFLRAFAVGGSSDLYDQIYEIGISRRLESPQDLFKYLSYPVLPVVFRYAENQTSTNMALLDTISKNEAFTTEFSKSEGFTWMPTFVGKKPAYFEEVLSVIYQAMSKCQGYSSAFLWINATLECQEAAVSAIGNGEDQITAGRLWGFISKNANTLTEHVKVRRKTGIVPQAARNTATNDAQERPPAADPVRGAIDIGKKPGLNSLEDESKPKLDSTAPREWSASDRENWGDLVDRVIAGFEDIRARIEAPTSSSDAYMLPRNDVSLLRKFTLTGPDDFYVTIYSIMDEIIASATMSGEYFHAPVLNKVMRMDSERISEITRTLRSISKYTWFTQEFIGADGLQLLPLRLRTLYLEETIEMVTNALSLATTYNDTLLWLRLVYSCLNSVGMKLEGSDSSRVTMLEYASSNLEELTTLLGNMKRKWNDDRESQPNDKAPDGDKANKGDVKSNARLWSPGEWEDVHDIMEELLGGGLKRGYIMPAPSAVHQCFIRDPDGLCSQSRPQRMRSLNPRLTLMTIPRDPAGLCTSYT